MTFFQPNKTTEVTVELRLTLSGELPLHEIEAALNKLVEENNAKLLDWYDVTIIPSK